jgi:DNA-binding NarL/FixJ family response regulator
MAPDKKNLTFLIVDDHPVLRRGIVSVLESAFSGARVEEADGYDEAVTAAESKKPDVVIADPNLGGLDATSSVTRLRKGIDAPIVVFAANGNMRVLSQALKAGARACVRKDSSAEVLSDAINAAREGRFYIDAALADDDGNAADTADLSLTERQREILQMFADGHHTERVAEALGLSTETIRTHTKRILAKLNANTRTHAVAIAVRAQILD